MSHPDLTPDQIDALARQWFADALEIDEGTRTNARPGKSMYTAGYDDGEEPVTADLEVLGWLEGEYREALAYNDFARVRCDVERLLTEVGIPVDSKSETFKRLARALLRANVEFLHIAKARRVGNYALEPVDPLFRPQTYRQAPAPAVSVDPVQPSLPLSKVMEAYIVAKERDGKWVPVTKKNTVNKLKLFVDTLRDKPVDAVTRDDIRDWREVLEDQHELSNNSIRHHFKTVAAMFNWAKDERKSTIDNPTRGLMPPPDDPKRDAFTADELKTLFSSPMYTGHSSTTRRDVPGLEVVKDFKYWFPLIGLHTGMRVEEIAKLRTDEVVLEDGVWCFNIRKTKTKAGERLVPIHPRLIALGFLDHVKSVRGERLWPELTPNSEGSYSHRFVVWFPEYRRLIGIDREGLVFHSFRHTFVSRLEDAGVDTVKIGRIVGHKITGITAGTYGGKLFTPSKRLELFKDLDFGVDLSHLTDAVAAKVQDS